MATEVKIELVVGEQRIEVGTILTAGDRQGYEELLANMVADVASDIERGSVEVYPYNNWDR